MAGTIPVERSHVIRSAALLILGTVLIDQVTKALATAAAAGNTSGAIVPVANPEFSLGLAAASVPVTVAVCAVGIVVFGGHAMRVALASRMPAWVPALLVGGAMSNLFDRLAFHAVRDFLATPWVVFNLADVAVVVGLFGLLAARRSAGKVTLEEVSS